MNNPQSSPGEVRIYQLVLILSIDSYEQRLHITQSSAGANLQQTVNYAVGAAIPALISVVDQRVQTVLGTAVSTMEAAANRVEAATQGRFHNPRKPVKKRAEALDEYDGDSEGSPTKPRGPKPTKINKQHVSFHYRLVLSLYTSFFSKGIHQEMAYGPWRPCEDG